MKLTEPTEFAKLQKAVSKMTALERAYRDYLAHRRLHGLILDYQFETVRLTLGEKCTYTPDFLIVTAEHVTEFHEVKGLHRWEDSIVKLKTAASLFPAWRFFLAERRPNPDAGFIIEWELTDYSATEDRR